MSFVDNVKTPNSENCYREQLALAIPTNIRNMKKFVGAQHADAGKKKKIIKGLCHNNLSFFLRH